MANEEHGNGVGYEATDPPVRGIVYSAFALAGFTVFLCVLLLGLLRILTAFHDPGERNVLAPQNQAPPEPRVEADPWVQLQRMHAEEEQKLGSYGWIDKEKTTLRIPIERAIDLTVERGLPTRKDAAKR